MLLLKIHRRLSGATEQFFSYANEFYCKIEFENIGDPNPWGSVINNPPWAALLTTTVEAARSVSELISTLPPPEPSSLHFPPDWWSSPITSAAETSFNRELSMFSTVRFLGRTSSSGPGTSHSWRRFGVACSPECLGGVPSR